MLKLNRAELRDKIHGCWLGKNIGGTMGTPYEARQEMQDITGFVTKPGEVLPNDDLDLQLIWLLAAEKEGLEHLNSAMLAEYWVSYIPAHWNEYGVGKCNLKNGLLPPLSGEFENDDWKNSNGAWIRSEIWATMAPGLPNVAAKYAFADASVDHGLSEGTYGEVFTATIESYAFVEKDIRKIIEFGLTRIPETCRVARSVRLVLKSYDEGVDYRTTRELLVEDSRDLGWFQAPANIAFTVLGLIYGEGDFKKSMIYAINCGDDTDCTGATVGAFLGLLYGRSGIPQDWASYLGDSITTVAIDRTAISGDLPKTCTELTDRVINMIPVMCRANGIRVEFTEEHSDFSDGNDQKVLAGIEKTLFDRLPYSYDGPECVILRSMVEFYDKPVIEPNGSLRFRVRFFNKLPDQRHLHIRLYLPEGWTASYRHDMHLPRASFQETGEGYALEVTVTAGEKVEAVNRAAVEVTSPGRPTAHLIPIILIG